MSHAAKIAFLGSALDPDEREPALAEKLASLGATPPSPYEAVLAHIRGEVAPERFRELGEAPAEAWLLPCPEPGQARELSLEAMVGFIDADGCRQAAEQIGELAAQAGQDIPCLIAVDHSLAGGVIARLSRRLGPENLSLVVLDAHTDAIPMSAVAGAVAYDLETNPQSAYDPNDPFLRGRPNSYNASSFLFHLLDEGAVLAKNLYLLGVADWPPKQALRLKDPRMKAYTGAYTHLPRAGVGVATRSDLAGGGAKLKALLKRIKTPYVYLSLDLDVGAGEAIEAVRFNDRRGLGRAGLIKLAHALRGLLDSGPALAGMDLCELNPRHPGREQAARLAADLIEIIAWGHQPGGGP
ncbi:MAG: arginase family protein [Desulfarculaceae bacterium]|nr:arginase family protein [Desulfarculaceae bacterium]MCF8072665.1 arginase family protein [Desulfarculaceae bacterium]MCF8102544.1 arginase family protein [Desulfarculaceae bacterium]MCF8116453.1 arginase family protein [Desulfarculaceae bacterium]